MNKNDFTIEGLNELIKAFADLGDEAMKKIDPAADEAGNIVLEKTKQKVPVGTGKLKASLRLKRSKGVLKVSNTLTWGDDAREYGAPLELGHGLVYMGRATNTFVQAKPFLRPAADESKEKVFDIITNAMNKTIDEIGGIK